MNIELEKYENKVMHQIKWMEKKLIENKIDCCSFEIREFITKTKKQNIGLLYFESDSEYYADWAPCEDEDFSNHLSQTDDEFLINFFKKSSSISII